VGEDWCCRGESLTRNRDVVAARRAAWRAARRSAATQLK